jgi:hypothetical protein
MALITPAQLKIAMLAVKPQPKAKGGPPARKVFGRKPVLRGSFKAASGMPGTGPNGGMPPVAGRRAPRRAFAVHAGQHSLDSAVAAAQ